MGCTTAQRICGRINDREVTLPGVWCAQLARSGPECCGVRLIGRQGQPLAILTEVAHYQALANHRPEPEWRWAPAGTELDLEELPW